MNKALAMNARFPTHLKKFAAELTTSVYQVALRHRGSATWLELELELWKAIIETLEKRLAHAEATVAQAEGEPRLS